MALAARDPFYLASLADEIAHRPTVQAVVEATCTRCHAPEAAIELEAVGTATPTFAMLTKEISPTAHLAREGVACTFCHQVLPDGLGTPESFTGGFTVGSDRMIFGPYTNPTIDPMRTLVSFIPTFGDQIQKSALCATCHTVITQVRDASGKLVQFPEQTAYLEWLASSFSNEGRIGSKAASCQDCHMPAADTAGATIESAISVYPAGLAKRKPFNRHTFAGGNAFLSRLAASDPTWIGLPLQRADHEAQAGANEAMLRTAATLAIGTVKRAGDGIELTLTVSNKSGHKFPTGYPSRRAWLHVRVTAGADVVYESGRSDQYGRLVGRGDVSLEPAKLAPHLDIVEREDQVQIYESVPVDAGGTPTHRPLDAHHYGKDNRLLPDGFDARNQWASFTAPIGTAQDSNFGSTDSVTYRIARAPAGAVIDVELLFQNARPSDVEALADKPTPAARKLFDLTTAAPPRPLVVATAKAAAP